jgi:hypothetical protein
MFYFSDWPTYLICLTLIVFLGEVDAFIDVVARIAEPVRDAILPTRNTQT